MKFNVTAPGIRGFSVIDASDVGAALVKARRLYGADATATAVKGGKKDSATRQTRPKVAPSKKVMRGGR